MEMISIVSVIQHGRAMRANQQSLRCNSTQFILGFPKCHLRWIFTATFVCMYTRRKCVSR